MPDYRPPISPRYNSFVSRGAEEDSQRSASDALLAYKAGVAAGKAHLLKQSKVLKKKQVKENLHSLLYSMGQWAVLLQCECLSTGPAADAFWSQQEAIAAEIQNDLRASDASEAMSQHLAQTVTRIQNAVSQIRATGAQADGCTDIASAMEGLENHLRSNLYPTN